MLKRCVLGLDIGGTNFRIGLVDRDNKVYDPKIRLTAELQSSNDVVGSLLGLVTEYMDGKKLEYEVMAVSMGFPSTIDKRRKTILSTPNINGLDQVPIVSIFENALNLPIFIDRDVNMLMYHDISHFNIPHDALTLGFYIGTGFGNAIYMNGEIHTGKHGVAGELGHIPMMNGKKRCPCGNEACVEAYASGRYLEELCETHFKGIDIKEIYEKYGDTKKLIEQVEYISLPIATEINIFDPDHIIIGGGLLQMKGFPRERLDQFIYKHSRKPYPADDLHVIYSTGEQENGIIGAGIYGFKMSGINA